MESSGTTGISSNSESASEQAKFQMKENTNVEPKSTPTTNSSDKTHSGPTETKTTAGPPSDLVTVVGEKKALDPSNPAGQSIGDLELPTAPVAVEEGYITPLEDPLDKASKYLAKHDIFGLLQNITAGIAYKRPGEPLNFMINEIEKLQEQERRRKGVITRNPSAKTARKPEEVIGE